MVMIELMNVHTDSMESHGPFEFVQLTYGDLRVGPNGTQFAANIEGWWQTKDGRRWSDVTIDAASAG